MATIAEYTDTKPAQNRYPRRIVSPSRSGPCCFREMEAIGGPRQEGQWVFQYRRCRTCGYAVRLIVRRLPDRTLNAEVRKAFHTLFQHNIPVG
ncbi:MAG TPA: hypothetical protein VMD08_15820 [Candidatus Baltobacteraceae bacterium]|nr:hypothetical protein [Candidatus Baltobacteraceae bacterium]